MDDEPVFEKISEDERGANYRVLLPHGQELLLIFTKAGYSRGGHFHDTEEVALVLTGRVEIQKMVDGRLESFERTAGQTYHNARGEPHVGTFKEDSWILDWKLTAKAGEFRTTDYLPFRKLVHPE